MSQAHSSYIWLGTSTKSHSVADPGEAAQSTPDGTAKQVVQEVTELVEERLHLRRASSNAGSVCASARGSCTPAQASGSTSPDDSVSDTSNIAACLNLPSRGMHVEVEARDDALPIVEHLVAPPRWGARRRRSSATFLNSTP